MEYCARARAQVYRGRLRSTGEEVAVKVQRPGIGENIAIDMVLLRRLMAAFDAALPRLRLPIQARLPSHTPEPSDDCPSLAIPLAHLLYWLTLKGLLALT